MKIIGLDLDGTLLDSTLRHKIVLDNVLKKYNININTSDLIPFKQNGKSTSKYLRYKNIPETLIEDIVTNWVLLIEDDKFLKYDTLYEDAIEFLNRNIENKLYIITSRKNEKGVKNQVEAFNLHEYINKVFVVPSGISAHSKKREIIIDENIEIFIGDTEVDFNATSNTNSAFIAINRGFRNKSFWDKKEIQSYNSLEEIII